MFESLKDITFTKYFRNRKIGTHPSNFCVIIPESPPPPRPIFCDICDCAMITNDDHLIHEQLGCCQHCRDNFYYPNKKEWDSGWRPEKKKDCNHVKTLIIKE